MTFTTIPSMAHQTASNLLGDFYTADVINSSPPNTPVVPPLTPSPISFALPAFNSQDPNLWFSIAEALFPFNSTSHDKYRALLIACPMSLT